MRLVWHVLNESRYPPTILCLSIYHIFLMRIGFLLFLIVLILLLINLALPIQVYLNIMLRHAIHLDLYQVVLECLLNDCIIVCNKGAREILVRF